MEESKLKRIDVIAQNGNDGLHYKGVSCNGCYALAVHSWCREYDIAKYTDSPACSLWKEIEVK